MKLAADFKRSAREGLKGRWGLAIGAGFIATLLGGTISSRGRYNSNSNNDTTIEEQIEKIVGTGNEKLVFTITAAIVAIAIITLLIYLFIGGAVQLGYAKFNLNIIDQKDASISDLFSQFKRIGTAFCMILLQVIYLIGWTLLFVIPGIIKTYSYAMTPYILYENPGMTANEAITESRRMMDGNKFRLFCLYLSFIGWELLCLSPLLVAIIGAIVVGYASGAASSIIVVIVAVLAGLLVTFIAFLFLTPYIEASLAAFYREVSGTTMSEQAISTQENEF